MKVYYFTVVAVGVMFLLFVGGVETNSRLIIDFISGNNPSAWASSGFWLFAIAAFAAFVATNRIQLGGFSFQASREAIVAAFITGIYVAFASDLFSIVTKVGSLTCPAGITSILTCSWEFWVAWAIIIPLMAGYTISLIEFVGGTD